MQFISQMNVHFLLSPPHSFSLSSFFCALCPFTLHILLLSFSSDIVAPGGGLEKGNAGVLCEVPEPMSVDEVLPQPSYTSIKEVESGSTAGPVGVCASAKPSEDSMADAETSEDTHPPKKRKAPERDRRGGHRVHRSASNTMCRTLTLHRLFVRSFNSIPFIYPSIHFIV